MTANGKMEGKKMVYSWGEKYMCHVLLRNRPHSSIKILFLRRLLLVIGAVSDCRAF